MLPNNINLLKLAKLLAYSNVYEISIQFYPKTISVFISKDGVELTDFGGDFDFAIDKAIEYLNRINKKTKLRQATAEDFKVGTTLIDSEGNKFCLRIKYAEGIWECNKRVHFENEAKHYKVEEKM